MRKVVKNLTFEVPNKQFENKGYILLPIDLTDPNIRSLVKWNPITIKAEYKVKLVNAKTRQSMRHELTGIEFTPDKKYVIASWNPSEHIDALIGLMPMISFVTLLSGIASMFHKDKGEQKQEKRAK